MTRRSTYYSEMDTMAITASEDTVSLFEQTLGDIFSCSHAKAVHMACSGDDTVKIITNPFIF